MLYSTLLALHILAVAIWVGGMFFAYNALRPAAAVVHEPPLRLTLWVATFRKFFPWVWLSLIVLLVSGLGMLLSLGSVPTHILIMALLAILMVLIFIYVYYVPYVGLKHAVNNENWSDGGKYLAKIRTLVGTNTIIGLITIIVATAGRSIF